MSITYDERWHCPHGMILHVLVPRPYGRENMCMDHRNKFLLYVLFAKWMISVPKYHRFLNVVIVLQAVHITKCVIYHLSADSNKHTSIPENFMYISS